jgi:hypothetical protein
MTGLKTEGIFRVPGSTSSIKKISETFDAGTKIATGIGPPFVSRILENSPFPKPLRSLVHTIISFYIIISLTLACHTQNSGQNPDFSNQQAFVEDVAGVLKKYLRDLPEPLISDGTSDDPLQKSFLQVTIGASGVCFVFFSSFGLCLVFLMFRLSI